MKRHVIRFLGLLCWGAAACAARADGHIEGKLAFSTDGGTTYADAFPALAAPQLVTVRAEWRVVDEDRPIQNKVVTVQLSGEDGDYASARVGPQAWYGGKAWFQRPDKYWYPPDGDQSAVLPLDLRARPEGVMGTGNRWDPAQGKQVDAPLPALEAAKPGAYRFKVRIAYKVAGGTAVFLELPFRVVVDGDKGSDANSNAAAPPAPASAPAAVSPAPAAPVPSAGGDPPPALGGVAVWEAPSWQVVAGAPALAASGGFVKPQAGQEIAFRVRDVAPGSYFLRLAAETGAGSGADELMRPLPFLFLNGVPLKFARASPPVAYQGTYVALLETAEPVALRPGDEVRWNTAGRPGRWVGGVAAAADRLALAPLEITPFYDPDLHDGFRLSGAFSPAPGPAGPTVFKLGLRNVGGAPGSFHVHAEVVDFWQNPVAARDEDIPLENRASASVELSFPPGESDRYRAVVHVAGPNGLERDQEFEEKVDAPGAARPRQWLNAGWEWASVPDDGTPASRTIGDPSSIPGGAAWAKVELPASWQDSRAGDHIGWYRRRFSVPAWQEGRTLLLHFTRVAYEARVFVNGKEIGSHFGQVGPFDFDITGAVRAGENEIVVGARDGIAALDPAELQAPKIEISSRSRFRAPDPLKAGIGQVWLDAAGPKPLRDVFVQTSWTDRKIDLDVELPPLPPGTAAVLSNRVLFRGKEVLRFPDLPVSGGGTVRATQAWPEPVLWNPGDPKLLQLRTELKDAGGAVLDRLDTRFGFREFRPDGARLVWNGRPVKFAGVPFTSAWGWSLTTREKDDALRDEVLLCKRMGDVMLRHIYDPEPRAEIDDEEGVVAVQGTGGIIYPTRDKLASDELWGNAAAFAAEMIRGMRNHPSIVTWYLSNEMYAEDQPQSLERLQALGKAVRPLDPTRVLEFGCDLDLGGFSQVVSTHYPVDIHALREEPAVFPEAAYWHAPDAPLRPGTAAPAGLVRSVANIKKESPIPWGTKPLVVNESCWNFFFAPPDGMTRLEGDRVYAGPVSLEGAYKDAVSWFMRGDRDAEASIVTPWENVRRAPALLEVPAVDINPVERYAHFYGGTKVVFDVNLHHDRPRDARLDFSWSLRRDGRELQGKTETLAFSSGDLQRRQVALTLPDPDARAACVLVLALQEDGKVLRQCELPVDLWPRAARAVAWPDRARLGIYDPAGGTAAALRDFSGPAPRPVAKLGADALAGLDALVVGENDAQADDPEARRALEQFARAGGRVLVLAQDKAPLSLPFRLAPTALVANRLWTFRPGHPLLRDLREDDLADWFPAQRTGAAFYAKPDAGNFETVAESGGPKGLIYSGLVVHPLGKGSFVCSQLALTAHLAENPIAAQLWRNALAVLAEPPGTAGAAGFWGDPDGALGKTVASLGAQAAPLAPGAKLDGLDAVLADGSALAKLGAADAAALRRFAEAGGRVWVHGVAPDNAAAVSALCGVPVRAVSAAGPAIWRSRAVRTAFGAMTAGLTGGDLFWKKKMDGENYAALFTDDRYDVAPLAQWTLRCDDPRFRPAFYPCCLAEVEAGGGRVLLDTVRWDAPDAPKPQALRIASTLLTDAGIPVRDAGVLTIPPGLDYRPVDISALLNRAFADPDGHGWLGAGNGADLAAFPASPAVQTLAGVPFRIGKGALVLKSPHLDLDLPSEAALPVQGRADALFFLQTSAWSAPNRHHASYLVQYRDGTAEEIKLVGDVNLRDWTGSANASAPFPFETDTLTRQAWSGLGKKGDVASLYCLAWPNPHPEKEIAGVAFRSLGEGVPILVAVTVGVRAGGDAAAAVPATAASDAEIAAGMAKAEASEARKQWAAAAAQYRTVLRARPGQLEAWYRLGKAEEELGAWDEAGDAYRRSMEINENQPEVLQAIQDLARKRNAPAGPQK